MRQATHDNSTLASRRGFLTTAASVAAGGTALALSANVTAPALAAPLAAGAAADPILALINAHRMASAAHESICNREEQFDPAAFDQLAGEACTADNTAMDDLLSAVPLTPTGLLAWVEYLAGFVGTHNEWYLSEERFWAFLPNLADALHARVSS